jgi:hypothetical protein
MSKPKYVVRTLNNGATVITREVTDERRTHFLEKLVAYKKNGEWKWVLQGVDTNKLPK